MSDKPYHDHIVMFKSRLWRNGIIRQTLYYKEKIRPPWITRLGQVRQSECLHSCYSISERHGMRICLTHGASSDATAFWTSLRRFVRPNSDAHGAGTAASACDSNWRGVQSGARAERGSRWEGSHQLHSIIVYMPTSTLRHSTRRGTLPVIQLMNSI